MKKFLLPIFMFFLTATGASAQNLTLTSKTFVPADIAKPSLSVTKQALKAPQKAGEQDLYLVGYNGSDGTNGIGRTGFSQWYKADMILSGFPSDTKLKVGHKIVGLRFCVSASLGENCGVLAIAYDAKGNNIGMVSSDLVNQDGTPAYEITEFPEDQGAMINVAWNTVMFTEKYEVTGNEKEILYGYEYTQATNGTTAEMNPIMFGASESTDYENMFLVNAQPALNYKLGVYYISSANQPYVPCFQLIMEDPTGETYILGHKGSDKPIVAKQYYSLDGKQLSAPQKGLNLVKMSDGTVRKVMK